MKIVSITARYLLGLLFTVFGLNGFLHFIHQPPPSDPLALQFLVAVSASHFAAFFFAVQVVGGLLLLSGYFVPLALILLAACKIDQQHADGLDTGLLAEQTPYRHLYIRRRHRSQTASDRLCDRLQFRESKKHSSRGWTSS